MEITQVNLTSLFTGFDVRFQQAFEKYPSYYESISSIMRSGTRQTTYPWLGRSLVMSEWRGERTLQALEAHGFTIINKNFEATIAVDRNDIEDDSYGIYLPDIDELGRITKVHPDQLLFGLIKQAVATPGQVSCYDGQAFFSASHPVGPMGAGRRQTTASNINTTGSGAYWYLIDASREVRPFVYQLRRDFVATRMIGLNDEHVFNQRQFRYGVDGRDNVGVGLWQLAYASNQDLSVPANYDAARAALRSIKTDAGLPFGSWSNRKGRYLVVPPSLEGVARRLLHAELYAAPVGGANVAPISNIWVNDADLIVSEYLE